MAKKRKNGQGTVRLRPDGRWEGRQVIGYDERKYPITKNVLAKTKRECIEKLKALQADIAPSTPKKITTDICFGDWLDYWYQNHSKPNLRPTTQSKYRNWIYNHITPQLGSIKLRKLDQTTFQKFLNDMKQNGCRSKTKGVGGEMAASSVGGCYRMCRMALDKAVEEGLLKQNPILGCKLPQNKPAEVQILEKDAIQRFLIQAKYEGMYELFLLELTTGLRRGELLALHWSDLNFETGELHINKQVTPVDGKLILGPPKTKAAVRTVLLPPDMLEILAEYKKSVFSDLMFPSRIKPEQPIDPGHVRKKLQAILKRAGCQKIRFHDLRHTFVTLSLEHGMDLKTLSTIIGHTSSSTTLNVYTHITGEMQKKAAATIDRGITKAKIMEEIPEENELPQQEFTPQKLSRRRPGTGCISQITEKLWEGRYSPIWPDGKKHPRNVYAHSEDECEALLKELIVQTNAEIAEARAQIPGIA